MFLFVCFYYPSFTCEYDCVCVCVCVCVCDWLQVCLSGCRTSLGADWFQPGRV